MDSRENTNQLFRDISNLDGYTSKLKNIDSNINVLVRDNKDRYYDISEEIIYLSSVHSHSSYKQTDQKYYKHRILDSLNKFNENSKRSSSDIFDFLQDIVECMTEYNDGKEFILHSPRYITMIPFLRFERVCYDKRIKTNIIKEQALKSFINYARGKVLSGDVGFNKDYGYIDGDEIGEICIVTLYHSLKSNLFEYELSKEIMDIVEKYCGEMVGDTWEEGLSYLKNVKHNRFVDLYLEYKKYNMVDSKYTGEERDEFLTRAALDIVTDFGKLDEKIIENTDKDIYIRCLNDSFVEYFSNHYGNITDLPDDSRDIAISLIEAYLIGEANNNTRIQILTLRNIASMHCTILENQRMLELKDRDVEKLKESHKIKLSMLKKDATKAKEQAKFHKEKSDKLVKELKNVDKESFNIMKETIDLLEDEIKELKSALQESEYTKRELNNTIETLHSSIDEITSSRRELEGELIRYRSEVLDSIDDNISIEVSSRDIPVEVLYNSFKNKKILLLGGNKIHTRLKEKHFDNIECLESGNVNFKINSAQKYDLVVIYTKLVSHSIVEKIESQMRNYNVPIIRFNDAGVNSLIHTIFMYLNSGDSVRTGEYRL